MSLYSVLSLECATRNVIARHSMIVYLEYFHKDRAILNDSLQRHCHKPSHHVSEARCPSRPTHLQLLHGAGSTDHLVFRE